VDVDELEARVQEILDRDVRPRLQSHAGDVTVASITPEGDVHLAFVGSCSSCPAKPSTAALGVTPVLERIPGVRTVVFDNVWISPHSARRLADMAQPLRDRLAREQSGTTDPRRDPS
jgi:Fe-S cluster biogenesis protein NfuA